MLHKLGCECVQGFFFSKPLIHAHAEEAIGRMPER
jgi:EAL domain-containing protein (putative c-di-GMP-specific phosphodiesterase class I)